MAQHAHCGRWSTLERGHQVEMRSAEGGNNVDAAARCSNADASLCLPAASRRQCAIQHRMPSGHANIKYYPFYPNKYFNS